MKTSEIQTTKPAPKKPTILCQHRWFYVCTDDEGTRWEPSYKHACEH